MVMSDLFILALAFVAGVVLGAVFFGGLWWTVHKSVVTKHSALWLFASWWLRMSTVLSGFYFVGRDQWQRLVICLLGFVVTRLVVLRLTRRSVALQTSAALEASHAS